MAYNEPIAFQSLIGLTNIYNQYQSKILGNSQFTKTPIFQFSTQANFSFDCYTKNLNFVDSWNNTFKQLAAMYKLINNNSNTTTLSNIINPNTGLSSSSDIFAPNAEFNINSFDSRINTNKTEFNDDLGFSLALTSQNQKEIEFIKTTFENNRDKYEKVSQVTGLPAELICAIHYREGGCNFNTYLHNGEPLGKVTTMVPKGKYFTDWTEAAIDAIKSQPAYRNVKSDDLNTQLEYAERYNGLGYRKRGLKSPYVWAATDLYTGGMYVKDGVFDASAKDKRVGVAAILTSLYA